MVTSLSCQPSLASGRPTLVMPVAGPTLVALICALALRMRLSRARIQEFLHDWLGLELGVATINQCIHEAGRAVDPVVQGEVLRAVREADLLHADETSWKEGGRPLWLWVFPCASATLFVVGKRTRVVLERVLGETFDQWLMSDGYWAYRDYDWRLRCLAHLARLRSPASCSTTGTLSGSYSTTLGCR
jgi:transposase